MGNDSLDGGAGNDYLNGGAGSDTYRFGRGSGQDTLYDKDISTGKTDVIEFAPDIAPSDIQLSRSGDNLVLAINGTTDKLTVYYNLQNDGITSYQLEQIRFNDGTLWNLASIKAMLLTGTANADTLTGYATDDTINAGGGNDTLYGRAGNDTLKQMTVPTSSSVSLAMIRCLAVTAMTASTSARALIALTAAPVMTRSMAARVLIFSAVAPARILTH